MSVGLLAEGNSHIQLTLEANYDTITVVYESKDDRHTKQRSHGRCHPTASSTANFFCFILVDLDRFLPAVGSVRCARLQSCSCRRLHRICQSISVPLPIHRPLYRFQGRAPARSRGDSSSGLGPRLGATRPAPKRS